MFKVKERYVMKRWGTFASEQGRLVKAYVEIRTQDFDVLGEAELEYAKTPEGWKLQSVVMDRCLVQGWGRQNAALTAEPDGIRIENVALKLSSLQPLIAKDELITFRAESMWKAEEISAAKVVVDGNIEGKLCGVPIRGTARLELLHYSSVLQAMQLQALCKWRIGLLVTQLEMNPVAFTFTGGKIYVKVQA